MKLDKILINYGLTEKQAQVYLACLELDSAPVQKIALKSALPRTTVYEVLELLKRKSLVSSFLKKKVRYFTAQDPNQLVKIAQNNVDELKEALPNFNAIFGKNRNKPTTRFYEGKQGMKIILEEILDEAKEIMSFVSADDLFSELGDDFYRFVERRFKKKIPACLH